MHNFVKVTSDVLRFRFFLITQSICSLQDHVNDAKARKWIIKSRNLQEPAIRQVFRYIWNLGTLLSIDILINHILRLQKYK